MRLKVGIKVEKVKLEVDGFGSREKKLEGRLDDIRSRRKYILEVEMHETRGRSR